MTIFDEPLLPEDAAARDLKVKKQTLAAWRNRRQGPPYVKVGRLVFYRPSHLKEWLESRVVRPSARVIAQIVALIIVVWFFGGAA